MYACCQNRIWQGICRSDNGKFETNRHTCAICNQIFDGCFKDFQSKEDILINVLHISKPIASISTDKFHIIQPPVCPIFP